MAWSDAARRAAAEARRRKSQQSVHLKGVTLTRGDYAQHLRRARSAVREPGGFPKTVMRRPYTLNVEARTKARRYALSARTPERVGETAGGVKVNIYKGDYSGAGGHKKLRSRARAATKRAKGLGAAKSGASSYNAGPNVNPYAQYGTTPSRSKLKREGIKRAKRSY